MRNTLFEESVTKNDFFQCCEFKVFSFETSEKGVEAGNTSECNCRCQYGQKMKRDLNICNLPLFLWGFLSLQVPPATSDPLAFISFSAKGTTVNLAERRSVAIQNVDNTVFIQTDKPIYKPGQKGYKTGKKARKQEKGYISPPLQDPEQNKIFQWLEVTSKHGIVQLSFPLIPEPILGSYRITVEKKSGEKEDQFFTVKEYVLPKFEVATSVPKRISFFDEEIRVNVCASYTYGQPVQGNARINVCQQHFYSPRCEQNQKETCEAVTGLASLISVSSPLYCLCLTGIQTKSNDYVAVNQENDRVRFKNMDLYYKRGIPYYGEVGAWKDTFRSKLPEVQTVLLELNEEYLANYTTNKNGTAAFSIDTSDFFDPSFKLRVSKYRLPYLPHPPQALFFVRRFYSRTNSFVKIEPVKEKLSCGQQQKINVHYILNKGSYRNAEHTNFYYVVSIFSITLTVTEKLAPSARLLLYTVHPHGEIVADSSWIQSDVCFKNKVKFSEKQGLPGSKVSLHLKAAANSYCALRAVDQSVLLLQPARELSAERVSHIPGPVDLYDYYYNGLNLDDGKPEACTPIKTTFFDGLYYEPVNVSRDGDVYRIFRVYETRILSGVNTVRKFFPETWIWDLLHTNSSGEVNVFYTIPDTITEWKASAFCMQDDAGFGISSPVSLTAFQPFFVDLTLPYSVIRGEKFNLIANVFNYLNKCIQVYQVSFYFLYVKFTIIAEAKLSTGSTGNSTFPEEATIHRDTLIQTLLVENLLHMPYGCGEQNMALFTPNIYALDYLNKTGQLTEEIRKYVFFIVFLGYQKQLSYKHRDGSYSSFGTRDREGSVWLTAFVYKSFEQAKRYIYIDDNVQSQALIWLASKQKSDGCFENAGSHFNNALKNGMNCLETAFSNGVHNLYNQALFAYAYGLADKEKRCQFFLEKLDKTATRDGKYIHWQRENKPPAEYSPVFYSRAPSAEIEMTSYVLLALLNKAKLTPEDLPHTSRIVRWLVKQQNPYGGFSSSQVTIGCALAQYGYHTFSKKNLNTVKVNFMEFPSKTFQVNDKNRFLLQQASLPALPGNYSVEVNGTGCNFSHFSYTGNRKVSNMAIINVKMLSGFVPVRSSLEKVKNGSKVNGKP
uniref:Ovostatin n=1 Tax=Strigops habroptila TaxID=2489341 RepID=A0A672UJV5_STRHB